MINKLNNKIKNMQLIINNFQQNDKRMQNSNLEIINSDIRIGNIAESIKQKMTKISHNLKQIK